MTSFLTELRRRHVVKVAAAYAVVAWIVAQVATIFSPAFQIPSWILQSFLVAIVLGLPVAIVLAWIYDITPEGVKRTTSFDESGDEVRLTGTQLGFVFTGLAILVIGFFYLTSYFRVSNENIAQVVPDTMAIGGDVRRSIAVLPFANIGGVLENEYFSDGLAEEILNLLAMISDLKVIGRTSSFAFKGQNADLRQIGNALSVNSLLQGSVRRSGDTVRVTAQLINVADGAEIWRESYEREMTDVFEVQDDIAQAILDNLSVLVGSNPSRGRPTENVEAYISFLKARVLLNIFELQEAEKIVLEAIEHDPDFAEAYELLASIYWTQAGGILDAADAQSLMAEAAAMALSIDPSLIVARTLFESGNGRNFSLLREIEALEQAARDKPDDPWVLAALVFNLRKAGYLQEALVIAERLVDVDPLSRLANGRLQSTLLAVGRTDEAFARMAVFDADKWFIGETNLSYRQDETAIMNFEAELEQNTIVDRAWIRELITAGRDATIGQAYLDRRIPEIVASMPAETPLDMERRLSIWYLYFGYVDQYFDYLLDLPLTDSSWSAADDFLDKSLQSRQLGFTSHPRFLDLAESMGLLDLWDQRGAPDFCSKDSGQWVCV